MCSTDLNLSLDGATFAELKDQYDDLLARTVGNMEMRGTVDAVITLKQTIHLERTKRSTPSGVIDVVIPTFKHDITSVMQAKDKVSGQLKGEYQLVFDKDEEEYVMRKIDNGQQSMFEDDEPNGRFVDKDYEPESESDAKEKSTDSETEDGLPAGLLGLPAPVGIVDADFSEVSECEEESGDGRNGEAEDAAAADEEKNGEEDSAAEPAGEPVAIIGPEEPDPAVYAGLYDETTPYGWLAQFVGQEMRVTEAMGNYTVRTVEGNKVVLSSATSPSSPFYCDRTKLEAHEQHRLICTGYGKKLLVISIQCAECGDALFTLIAPNATEAEVRTAMGGSDTTFDEGDAYPYDAPEE